MQSKLVSAFRKTAETFTRGAKALPKRYFVSEEIFKQEQDQIFSKQWLCAGHQSEIATSGDYVLQQPAGESVIILRDHKLEARAFYNVCRHRGTRLCEEKRGRFPQTIQCP